MRISDHGAPAQPERSEQGKARRYLFHGQSVVAPALAGGLHLVATPIGNLRDITLRALEVLAAADLIACEDTRVTRKLIDHYGIATPLTPYHDHNADVARPKLLARLAARSWNCSRRRSSSGVSRALGMRAGRLRGEGLEAMPPGPGVRQPDAALWVLGTYFHFFLLLEHLNVDYLFI